MTNEEHLALMDKLTLLALGEMPHAEAAQIREHLETCDTCRHEFQEVSEGMVLLALTASGPAAPARAKERLLRAAQIWEEPRPIRSEADDMPRIPEARAPEVYAAYTPMRRPWWSFVPAIATLVLAAFALLLWYNNARLRDDLQDARVQLSNSQAKLTQAQLLAEALTSPNSQRVTLVSSSQKPQPSVDTMYMPKRRAVVLIAHNMAAIPEGKAYELWLLPANGAPPMACGVFRPQSNGSAMMTHTDMSATPDAKGFAITIEAAKGSEKPTSPVIMSGF